MGVLKDLGTGTVHDIDPLTGYPRNQRGHILNSISHRDGSVTEGWEKAGTELVNTTSPYGHRYFAIGSGDDFHCFDHCLLECGPRGVFMILHSVVNSETGNFIQDGSYYVLPANTDEDHLVVVDLAADMVLDAMNWCLDNNIRHDSKGWNQKQPFFVRATARCLRGSRFEKCSDREMRFGSKRVNTIVEKILLGL